VQHVIGNGVKMKEDKNFSRRKFFVTAGISTAGIALLNKLPFVSIGASNTKAPKIKVSISPNAVKRTK
jgi:hypothetical protein